MSGVQGNILGPLLFNLYVNIVNNNKKAKFVSYADDTSIFIYSETSDALINMANLTLLKIKSWCDNNSLKINISKTKSVIFRQRNKSKAPSLNSCPSK